MSEDIKDSLSQHAYGTGPTPNPPHGNEDACKDDEGRHPTVGQSLDPPGIDEHHSWLPPPHRDNASGGPPGTFYGPGSAASPPVTVQFPIFSPGPTTTREVSVPFDLGPGWLTSIPARGIQPWSAIHTGFKPWMA